MFIRFFKTNQPASFIALPLFAVLLWGMSWLNPLSAEPVFSMPFYSGFEFINSVPLLSEVLAFVLVLIQGFYLNYLINKYDLRDSRDRSNFLPALFCIFFLSLFPSFRTLIPQHFSAIFLLLMLDRIFDSYRKDSAFSHCFDAGLFASIASLFYFPAAVFFLLVWVGFVVLRAFNWREWLIAFLGFIIPWLMVLTYYFFFDRLDYFFTNQITSGFSASYFDFGKPDNAVLIYVFSGLLFFPAMMNFVKMMSSGKIKVNKFLLLFMWFLFFAVVSGFIFPVASYTHFTLAAIPLAVIFSNWFLSLKKTWIAESLFLILLGAFIYAEVMNRV
jgi:hypothetical protein